MALVLDDPSVDAAPLPDPAEFDDPHEWIEAVGSAEAAQGPHHGTEPAESYAMSWVLWLSQVPYGALERADRSPEHARVPTLGGPRRTRVRPPRAGAIRAGTSTAVDAAGHRECHHQPSGRPLAESVPLDGALDPTRRGSGTGRACRAHDAVAGSDAAGVERHRLTLRQPGPGLPSQPSAPDGTPFAGSAAG